MGKTVAMSAPARLATLMQVSMMTMALILLAAPPTSARPIGTGSVAAPRQAEPVAASDRNFVEAAYNGLLGRSPDEAGLKHWVDNSRVEPHARR